MRGTCGTSNGIDWREPQRVLAGRATRRMENKSSFELMRERADAEIAARKKQAPNGTNGHCEPPLTPPAALGPSEEQAAALTRITRARPQRAKGDIVQPSGTVDESAVKQWEKLGLARIGEGTPFATADNAERIISGDENYANRLYFDTV